MLAAVDVYVKGIFAFGSVDLLVVGTPSYVGNRQYVEISAVIH
jgi:hypothetical protein